MNFHLKYIRPYKAYNVFICPIIASLKQLAYTYFTLYCILDKYFRNTVLNWLVVDFISSMLFFLSVHLGGETAEMPGTYQSGHFEVSGFVVGAVERSQYLPRSDEIIPGDVVIGIPSAGVHSNGFSLVRAIVSQCRLTYDLPCPFETGKSLGMFATSFLIWP